MNYTSAPAKIMKIDGIIRGWYKKNIRDLPWRYTNDPYKVWIAEVILQQTRVNQGLKYYLNFTKAFPSVDSLALASEEEVLKIWQGLGYYNRARNLHHAAKHIVEQLEGEIPGSYNDLLKLKGVGNYTASAIASICFGEARAVVDGNVSRVVARLFGVEEPINSSSGSKVIHSLARELMDDDFPGNHNQAMMDFGAVQCVPGSPDCSKCPLIDHCEAHRTGRVNRLPVKIPKQKPKERWMYYYIIVCNGETVLTKRGTENIWKSLYQFPMVESDSPLSEKEVMGPIFHTINSGKQNTENLLTLLKISDPIRHPLTHRIIHARFIHFETRTWPNPLPSGWIKIFSDQIDDFPVPRLINRYVEVTKI